MLFGRLPIRLTHRLSLYPAALVWALLRLGVRPIEYFRLIAKFDFPHLRAIVFDQMLPRIAHYWPRETVANMMAAAGLGDVRLIWVNEMSWVARWGGPETGGGGGACVHLLRLAGFVSLPAAR